MVHVIEQNPKALLARREISLKELLAVELAIELAFLHKKKALTFQALPRYPIPAEPRCPRTAASSRKSRCV
jgi:hypothetical protein